MEEKLLMRTRIWLLASVSSLALAGAAAAADMPIKAAPYAAAPTWSWAGCYVGGHLAAVEHQDKFDGLEAEEDVPASGSSNQLVFGGGGQIGCNWQDTNLVYGIEGDGTFFKASHDQIGLIDDDHSYHTQMNWVATLRARAGITAGSMGRTLIFVTGGLALGGAKDGVLHSNFNGGVPTILDAPEKTLVGWTAGFGAEYLLTQNWTVKAEALYVSFQQNNVSVLGPLSAGSTPYTFNHSHDLMMGRIGMNYKF